MRQFDYTKKWKKMLTPEIVRYLTTIHEYKGEQRLIAEHHADVLESLVEGTVCASSRVGSIQKLWNMRTSITLWHPPRIRLPYSADGVHFSTTLTVRCRSSFPLSTVVPIPAAAIKSISRKRMTTITASGTSLPGC